LTGEFAAISEITGLVGPPPPGVPVWIGDDAASVEVPEGHQLLLAADTVVAGVHADLSLTTLADLGWKAVAASVSDIAAMGGTPGHALVAVSGSPDVELGRLYEGIAAAAREFACPVVGGDLTNSQDLVVTVAVTGWSPGRPVTRSGARPGHFVFVTGPLGASAAGLRLLRGSARVPGAGSAESAAVAAHARPVPQLRAGRAARDGGASAMIDVSDGFAADIGHVADASGVGLSLDFLPVHPAATEDEALSGGEDYVLVFCAPEPDRVNAAFARVDLDPPVMIGRCSVDTSVRTLGGAPLGADGWQHRWSSPG
jgi:thiamine-monophosphate kinase